MVDFAKLNERNKERDRRFRTYRSEAYSGGDWDKLSPEIQHHIKLAWDRGYGQGYAQGVDYGKSATD